MSRLQAIKKFNLFLARDVFREGNYMPKRCVHCSGVLFQQEPPEMGGSDVVQMAERQQPKVMKKQVKISRAMQAYLDKTKKAEDLLQAEIKEYEYGKRHLANIMGADPDDFTQQDVNQALQYLLPSGLHHIGARPLFRHPLELRPQNKAVMFTLDGRPNHSLFYTTKPGYYKAMHEIAQKLETLKKIERLANRNGWVDTATEKEKEMDLKHTHPAPLRALAISPKEEITTEDDRRFHTLMGRLIAHPLSYLAKDFIMKFRVQQKEDTTDDLGNKVEPQSDEHGRKYYLAMGKRKTSVAKATVYMPGTGNISINEQSILYFKDQQARENVVFPLQLTNMLEKVDVVAEVENGGEMSQAGAVRLAVSRALSFFLSEEDVMRMKLAGLLTSDPRKKERLKSGQWKARKKFTWIKR